MSGSGGRRTGLAWMGVAMLLAGVGGAVALWLAAEARYDDGVERLARAPVGCDTVLDFPESGEYLLFVETTGRADEIVGDCDTSGRSYSRRADDIPRFSLTLSDEGGDEVDLDRATGIDYDRAGFVGTVRQQADIVDAGQYVLRVESDDDEFAIAVGRDPSAGVSTLRVGAGGALAGGVVLGTLALLFGMRRRVMPGATGMPPAPAGGPTWHTPAPTAPRYGSTAPDAPWQPGPAWQPTPPATGWSPPSPTTPTTSAPVFAPPPVDPARPAGPPDGQPRQPQPPPERGDD